MSKKVSGKQGTGTFSCEWVDEVLPLGKDRKTIFVPKEPVGPLGKALSQLEDMFYQNRAQMLGILAMTMNALVAKYGDGVWEVASKTMYDFGYKSAKEAKLADVMKINPEDARSVGRIFDFQDTRSGIKGEWIESGKKRAVKRVYVCPLSNAAKLCPDICTRMMYAVCKGSFDALGIKLKDLSFGEIIPKGGRYCDWIIELED